ncbi:MAG: hypothetical protein WCJ70_01185 [bacterium]
MKNIFRNKKDVAFLAGLVVLIAGAVFLRFYRIPEFLTFLSDQGRDAIILKRIVMLEKWVFVGPTTSIGNVFTGPFFYYLVAPFMLLSGLDPAGPAYGIALINTVGLILSFVFVLKNFGKSTAFFFLVFAGYSVNQIMQSRFSWNPNPVSTFSFIALMCWYYAIREIRHHRATHHVTPITRSLTRFIKESKWHLITGIMLGLCLQLHYVTILLILPIGLYFLSTIFRVQSTGRVSLSKEFLRPLYQMILGFLGGVVTFTPLILFDIKNKFINLHTLLRATSTGEIQAKSFLYYDRLTDTLRTLWFHSFGIKLDTEWSIFSLFALILLTLWIAQRYHHGVERVFIYGCLVVVVSFVPLFALIETGRHVHYYNHLYLALYFLVALILNSASRFNIVKLVWCVGLGVYMYQQMYLLPQIVEPMRKNTQMTEAKNVATYIKSQITSPEYQVVGLPFYETEGHYRYYLEYLGARPMTADSLGDPHELFVICHQLNLKDCEIPGNAQWQLADFQNRHPQWRVVSAREIAGVRVYKIVQQ